MSSATPKNDMPPPYACNGINVYMRNLPPDTQASTLRAVFSPYGDLGSVRVAQSRHDSTCYGFVMFKKREEGRDVVLRLSGTRIYGYEVEMREADNTATKKIRYDI